MQWVKILVGVSNALLLLAAAAVWGWGATTKNPARKRVGTGILSVWLVYDLITLLLAWHLGWFA